MKEQILANELPRSPQWGTVDAEIIKARFVENPELSKVPSFKFGVGKNIALFASPAGRNAALTSAFLLHSISFLLVLFKHKVTYATYSVSNCYFVI